MEAIYSLFISGQFTCRIPKKSGNGYLKSALGGHHHTPIAQVFMDACHDIYQNVPDYCDIDGYLTIDCGNSSFINKKEEAEHIMKALNVAFPRITSWREVSFEEIFNS